MTKDGKAQDLALLAYLRGGDSANATSEPNAPVLGDEVEQILRAMGYNRKQREEMRRHKPRPAKADRHHATTLKRFAYYVSQRLPNLTPGRANELAKEWASLTSYDVDLAQRWWTSGINPDNPAEFSDAIARGLRIEDLGEVVHGKTIAEHLQAGNSPTWCLGALRWRRSA